MKTVSVNVVNRVATITSGHPIFSGNAGVDSISFTLDSEWNSYTSNRKAYFYVQDDECFFVSMTGTTATIPANVLDKEGAVYAGIIAENGNNKLCSSPVCIAVGKGASPNDMLDASQIKSLLQTIQAIRGVNRITPYFACSTSDSVAPEDSSFSTTALSYDPKKQYIWCYYKTFYTTGDPTITPKFLIGVYGRGVKRITPYFACSESGTTAPADDQFTVNAAAYTPDKPYVWCYYQTIFTSEETISGPKFLIGIYGKGVTRVQYYWARNNDKVNAPESTEFKMTRINATPSQPNLWAYITTNFTDGSSVTTPAFLIGSLGDKGEQGDQGIQGPPGQDSPDIATIMDWITKKVDESTSVPFDSGYQSDDGYIHLTNGGEDIEGFIPFLVKGGGGGSGGPTNPAEMTLSNAAGWTYKSIAEGSPCPISFEWSSLENGMETGEGMLRILNNRVTIVSKSIPQGTVEIDLSQYLTTGVNKLTVQITDAYNNSRTLIFRVNAVKMALASNFDADRVFNNVIQYSYIPTGAAEKTIHFKLDGKELSTETVTDSGRQQTKTIPRQSHGSHTFEVWFTAELEGSTVESNHLFYDIICIEAGNEQAIISCDFSLETVKQYSTVVIPYKVYSPLSMTSNITINGQSITVDRAKQYYSYRASTAGEVVITIACGDISKVVTFTVEPVEVNAEAETRDLKLYLGAYGRSNGEDNPAQWKYKTVSASFENFSWIDDGWVLDGDGATVLRLSNNGKVTIPYKVFKDDFRGTGQTIEIEFATHNVTDIKPIIYCGNRLVITPQLATLKSEQTSIEMPYKEDEHLRISFVVEKQTENRLVYLYIDGVMSGVIQYPTADNFAQSNPDDLVLYADGCVLDIYAIRIYSNNLNKEQVLTNWIADTQNGELLLNRYSRNDVFDEYSNIVIDKLPQDLPYLILECDSLPQYKGDKKTVSGRFVDPMDDSHSYSFEDASFDVQGTSSQFYARKNYKGKYKQFVMNSGRIVDKFSLRAGSIAVNAFCYKADVASSEGANNVELARLYTNICPRKTPAMEANPQVRWGIDGFPIVVFWSKDGETTFLGKYNFNYDKGTEEVFGFKEGDESWEIRNNTSDRVIFKNDDYSGDDWLNDFEARYPEDNTDATNLSQLAAWIKSTDGNVAKFKSEFTNWFDKDSTLFYYLFTELFLMVDSRAKNAFPTYISDWGKWTIFPYDFDTALGINNEGGLLSGNSYALQDIDHLSGGANVFNGQDSVLWNNVRQAYPEELKAMYQSLRSSGKLSYEVVNQMFEDHQSKWCEAIVNEDARYKYIDPLTDEGNSSYLSMLQGLKASQRKWWLYNRLRYMDSLYNSGDDLTDTITLRGYAKYNLTLVPYIPMYLNVKYGSYLVTKRAEAGQSYLMECPLTSVNDTEIYIHSASMLTDIGDISGFKVGYADFSKATRLKALTIGSGESSYSNENLTELHLGNNTLLESIDIRNCPNLTSPLDLSKCSSLEVAWLNNSGITGVALPQTGRLKTLVLPDTLTNLTVINQPNIRSFSFGSLESLTTLNLENNGSAIDPFDLIVHLNTDNGNKPRVRIIGFRMDVSNTAEIDAFYTQLDKMSGIDENGYNTEKAQVSGVIHIGTITGNEVVEYMNRYPLIQIEADHISCEVKYYNYDGSTLLHTETVLDGGDATYNGSPSRPSDVRYTYTFAGWSKIPNGNAASDAQKKVTYDRNLYAAYTAVGQKYTVRFYNGSTLLQTVNNVLYGGSASYNGDTSTLVDPEGSGMPFEYWQPAPTNITGNTSCYAKYKSPVEVKEIEDDWSTILASCLDGTYKDRYNIGNYKPIDLGSEGVINAQIAGFDCKKLADGSGYAPIAWIGVELPTTSKVWNSTYNPQSVYDYKMGPGFEEKSGSTSSSTDKVSFTSLNTYPDTEDNHAKCSINITALSDTDIVVTYSVSNGGTPTVFVNGESFDSGTNKVTNLSTGETLTVIADYLSVKGQDSKVTIQITGHYSYTVVSESDTRIRYRKAYVNGTGNVGGWKESQIRKYYNETIYPMIPESIRVHIVQVENDYDGTDSETMSRFSGRTCNDFVWAPSYSELYSSKTSGGIFITLFPNNNSKRKKKYNSSSYNSWWMRTTSGSTYAHYVYNNGYYSNIIVFDTNGVPLCFCT